MIGHIFRKAIHGSQGGDVPALVISKVISFDDYMRHVSEQQQVAIANSSFEKELIPANNAKKFKHHGYCYVCKAFVDFSVDFKYAANSGGVLTPNWRERLICPICRLNNRMRAVVHVLDQEYQPNSRSKIYITEQISRLYKHFQKSFTHVVGSEFLGDAVKPGSRNVRGIRNEDLTQLSFADDEFDFILTFDVLEHIPNYKKALAECFRCVKSGGVLFFSVPFERSSKKNIVRARISEAGEIVHLLPPEYHGNPISVKGCLCYYHFGWELLNDLKAEGFKDSTALLYWSKEFGYLGGEQLIFVARKQ